MSNQRLHQRQQASPRSSSSSRSLTLQQQFQLKQQFQRQCAQIQQIQKEWTTSLHELQTREELITDINNKNQKLIEKLSIDLKRQEKEFQQLRTDDISRRINNNHNNPLPIPPQTNPNNFSSVILNQIHGLLTQLRTMCNKQMTYLINKYPVQVNDDCQQQQQLLYDYQKILDYLIKIGKSQQISITLKKESNTLSVTMPPPFQSSAPIFVPIQQQQQPVSTTSPTTTITSPLLVEATLNDTTNICTQHNNNNNNNTNPFRKTPMLASTKQLINKKRTKGTNSKMIIIIIH